LDRTALAPGIRPADVPLNPKFEDFIVERPESEPIRVRDSAIPARVAVVSKRDYAEREARNRALGLAGELLTLQFEQHRLSSAGRTDLARKVIHASVEQGDGLGFDIASFDLDGRERFIEVKTTSFSIELPFFVSDNEVRTSERLSDRFHLYRLFDFRRLPRMYQLPGPLSASCLLDPCSFRAVPL